ncbi:MAG: MscL family protein [Candidatus Thorarchaeota archaeon]|jgi:large conductance mechanosensitive channel
MKKKFIDKEIKRTKNEFEKEVEGLIGKERFGAWKKFAFKDEMMKMAIAFVLGAAFKKVVTGISSHVIMPLLGWTLQLTGTDWREHTYEVTEGLVFETGQLAGTFVDFILISIILFMVYKRVVFVFKEEVKIKCIETISCKNCLNKIHYLSKRCPHCTSWVEER